MKNSALYIQLKWVGVIPPQTGLPYENDYIYNNVARNQPFHDYS